MAGGGDVSQWYYHPDSPAERSVRLMLSEAAIAAPYILSIVSQPLRGKRILTIKGKRIANRTFTVT